MKKNRIAFPGILTFFFLSNILLAQQPDWFSTFWPHKDGINYDEPYRGMFHFSPMSGWMNNDIDMLVYFNGIYQITYQAEHENVGSENIFPSNPKIMPLGASRVEGDRPDYESFRYELWKNLIENGRSFDYIGTMTDPAFYANYSGQVFDKDHEGHGGYTSGQILSNINEWISSAGKPDIVLFSSPGGNDALEGLPVNDAISNINGIIDAIQAANPDVTIFIEQPAPAHSDIMTAELTAYIEKLQSEVFSIATQQTTVTSNVIAIDMFTGWSDTYIADDVHYNATGAKVVADRYDATMDAFYPGGTTTDVKKKDSPAYSLIYPNPVKKELHIVCNETIESYKIYSTTGCLMEAGQGNKVDVSKYLPGIYIIRVNDSTEAKFCKR